MLAYFNNQYLPHNQIHISPDDRGLLFADGLYEVMRGYDGKIFRAREHIERLNFGARELRFYQTEFSYLIKVAEKLIHDNDLLKGDALIYIQVTRGAHSPRAHRFPPPETPLTVYVTARPFQTNVADQDNGINAILVPDVRWARTNIKSVGLLPNVLAHQQALDRGASEAIFVRDGFLMEGTHSNIFAVLSGEVITPPLTNHILAGITRKAALDLCRTLAIPFQERPLRESEALSADELIITGTTVEVTPVVRLEGKPVGAGKVGIMARQLQEKFGGMTE